MIGQGETISQFNLLYLSTTSSTTTEHALQTKVRRTQGATKVTPL